MGRLLFVLPSVGAGDAVRIDTASGTNTPADIVPAGGGPAITGAVLHAGVGGELPRVLGPADGTATLYLKHLNYRGTVTGSPVTLTGSDLDAVPSAASGALHATKLAQAGKPGPVTVLAGQGHTLDFTGSTIVTGDDYWGSPNTALPLGITVSGSGIVLPDDDATYDLYANASVTCDVADAGKMLGISCAGNDSNGYGWMPAPATGGSLPLDVFMVTRVFAGDGPYDHVGVVIDATHMTQNVTVDYFNLFVSKR